MVVGVDETTWIRIDPERDRVRVRCGGALDGAAAAALREDCVGLIDRGFERVILDMSATTTIAPAVVSAIAGVNRRARVRGCRFTVLPGSGGTVAILRWAGLLEQLELEGASQTTFLDWTR